MAESLERRFLCVEISCLVLFRLTCVMSNIAIILEVLFSWWRRRNFVWRQIAYRTLLVSTKSFSLETQHSPQRLRESAICSCFEFKNATDTGARQEITFLEVWYSSDLYIYISVYLSNQHALINPYVKPCSAWNPKKVNYFNKSPVRS